MILMNTWILRYDKVPFRGYFLIFWVRNLQESERRILFLVFNPTRDNINIYMYVSLKNYLIFMRFIEVT